MRLICIVIFSFSLNLILSCSTPGYFKSKEEIIELSGRETLPTSDEFPGIGSIVLYEENLDDYVKAPTVTSTYYKAKLILNNDDSSSADYIYLAPESETTKILARVISPDNTIKELDDTELRVSSTIEGNNKLSNVKIIKISYPPIPENSILELFFQSKEDELIRGYSEYFLQNENEYKFLTKLIVRLPLIKRKSNIGIGLVRTNLWHDIIRPPVWSKSIKYGGVDSSSDEEVIYGTKFNDYFYLFRNIEQLKPEPLMPPDFISVPNIKYCIFKEEGWDYYADIYYFQYFLPAIAGYQELKPYALELVRGCTDDIDKIRNLYNYVSGMRFENIPFGVKSIHPAKPTDVIKRHYGDSKDKSALLVALLRSIDITACPVLAVTKDYRDIDLNFPEFAFDKMIVMARTVEGREIFLDPTITHCPINQLSVDLEGTNLFVIENEGKYSFKNVKCSEAIDNRIIYSVDIVFDSLMKAQYEVYIRFYGEKDLRYRNNIFKMEYIESIKYIKEMLDSSKFAIDLQNLEISNFYDVNNPFTVHFTIRTNKAAIHDGNSFILDYDIFRLDEYGLSNISKNRHYPVYLDYAYSVGKNISITYDTSKFILKNAPRAFNIGDNNITYSKSNETSSGKITLNEQFYVQRPLIPVIEINSLKDIIDSIITATKERIILTEMKH
jgi:hypothetical protein